jgi:hypothetical protein
LSNVTVCPKTILRRTTNTTQQPIGIYPKTTVSASLLEAIDKSIFQVVLLVFVILSIRRGVVVRFWGFSIKE